MGGDRALAGVKHHTISTDPEALTVARERARVLVERGVCFRDSGSQVPWLVATAPHTLTPSLTHQLQTLGEQTFAFMDAVQDLYRLGHPIVRTHLDLNIPMDLRGHQLDQRIITFRLDVTLERGQPKVTEIEEVYGNAGKLHAMEAAYGVSCSALYAAFARQAPDYVFIDDGVVDYGPELQLMRARLADDFRLDVQLRWFSELREGLRGRAWRFCYTRDFQQYSADQRAVIMRSRCEFFNPLFHGFGTKALLALVFEPTIEFELRSRLGADGLQALRTGYAHSRLLVSEDRERGPEAVDCRRDGVLKIIDCPGEATLAWGSRGVFFGDRSTKRWRAALEAARRGEVPGRPELRGAQYIVSQLIESDRFDVPFLHPDGRSIELMPRARVRLGPIYFRDKQGVAFVGGHATFVNTSRKVHLGRHAVCGPLCPAPNP